jgi:uncharacterized coiled-coil DUF342 family protein
MKIVDEKKALAQISQLRKSRKSVESFAPQQKEIDADKAKVEELRKLTQGENPEWTAVSERYGAVRAELDALHKETDSLTNNRNALFEQRNSLSKQIDELWAKKKESRAAWKAENDRFCMFDCVSLGELYLMDGGLDSQEAQR